jgi:hypothetical protein
MSRAEATLQAKTIAAFIIGPKASKENWCQQVPTFLSLAVAANE